MCNQFFVMLSLALWGMLFGQLSSAAEAASNDYFPLAVGNRWVYESSEGKKEAPTLETWEVIRREGSAFVVATQQPFMPTGALEDMFELVAQGVQRRELGSTNAEAYLFLQLPPVAGVSWQNADGRYAITSLGETITVPAGTFTNCVEVTRWREKTNVTVISTYAPGVGMIRREERFPIIGGFGSGGDFDSLAKGRAVLTLREWRLQGQPFQAKTKK